MPENQVTSVGYGDNLTEVDPDSEACLAKRVTDHVTGTTRYFAKEARVGPDSGRLWNSSSPNYDPRLRAPAYRGCKAYEFRSVSKEAFDYFLRFLETHNPSHVHHAERL